MTDTEQKLFEPLKAQRHVSQRAGPDSAHYAVIEREIEKVEAGLEDKADD
jgi:hypothetical protein